MLQDQYRRLFPGVWIIFYQNSGFDVGQYIFNYDTIGLQFTKGVARYQIFSGNHERLYPA